MLDLSSCRRDYGGLPGIGLRGEDGKVEQEAPKDDGDEVHGHAHALGRVAVAHLGRAGKQAARQKGRRRHAEAASPHQSVHQLENGGVSK